MTDAVRVGLVGAGPWARFVHAPMLTGTPGLRLASVWARRPDAAAEVAASVAASARDEDGGGIGGGVRDVVSIAPSYEALVAAVDVVAFAVPPAVQAELAPIAARAGRTLLLEKPLAEDLAGARRLADAIAEVNTTSQVMFTWRYSSTIRDLLADAADRPLMGGVATFLHGALLDGPFRTPWRVEHGPLLDLGPHVIDLLDAALGPIAEVRARGDRRTWIGLHLVHESGAVSTAALSSHVAGPGRITVDLAGPDGLLSVDCSDAVVPATFATIGEELVRTARGTPHPLDAAHALRIQEVIARAEADLVG